MTDRTEQFSSEWLKGDDLKGERKTVTIASVDDHVFPGRNGGPSESKTVLTFEGARKKLVLNTTRGKRLISLFGGDDVGWIGKRITLSAQPSFNGVLTVVIDPAEQPTPEPAPVDNEIPF